jgi:4-amino-4-deoxy-L-arabinose transferase-like glycosyltransferase
MTAIISNSVSWFKRNDHGEKISAVAVFVLAAFLLFYNLDLNPRPWQDEGAVASIAKSLVQNGVYATKTSNGYETYGGVQSVGPTVVLPVALAYRLWGVGLVQGRWVMALYAFITLVLLYQTGLTLFNRRVAIVAVILVLGSQAVGYFIYGRPVFGEVPALGFFLAGWLVWNQAIRRNRSLLAVLAGLLVGLAMVTKAYYVIIVSGTIVLLAVMDWVFYHQHRFKYLLLLGGGALACYGIWTGWQWLYFGADVFAENLAKLRQLASATSGIHPTWIGDAVKRLIGPDAGHFYFFWGFLSLLYAIPLCLRRTREAFLLATVWLLTVLWLAYYVFWSMPIPRYVFPFAAIMSLFVAKLFHDVASGFAATGREFWPALRRYISGQADLPPLALVSLGALVGLTSFILLVGYEFQRTVRLDVLDTEGVEKHAVATPPQLGVPQQVADFLNQHIDRDKVIETWERELGVLTDHTYHYPDQLMLAKIDSAVFHNGGYYSLGADYFNSVRPSYVIDGWFARGNHVYDANFLKSNARLIASLGDGDWRYDIYQMNSP